MGLRHDLEQVVRRSLVDVVHLRDAAAEVLHRLTRSAALQRLVRAVKSVENGITNVSMA